MLCSLSSLEENKLEKVRTLENELGKRLLSFTCHDLAPTELKDDELNKIKTLESELGVALVAV